MTTRKTTIVQNTTPKVQPYRLISQSAFTLISVWIGVDFYFFIRFLATNGLHGSAYRPAGVEAYLPISSLMSFVYFLQTGSIHGIHPAGFLIFSGIIIMSFVLGKSFCSWVCPVGFISDMVGDFGKKLLKKNFTMPRWADFPMRSLKYLLLLFFFTTIITMSVPQLLLFLNSDYNIIADIKLYEFFRYLSSFSIVVLTVLLLLSIPFRNFWCRYLCPYGALLGLAGLLSILKIRRNAPTCIDCKLCDKACPSSIIISKANYVVSDECTSCLQCVDVCPVDETLDIRPIGAKKKINSLYMSIAAVMILCGIILYGIMSHTWKSSVQNEKFIELYNSRDFIGH